MRFTVASLLILALAGSASARQFGGNKLPRFDEVVRKVESKFEPDVAKPGETVTWSLSMEVVNGWHTYPTKQPDENASSFVNKIRFPKVAGLEFGPLVEPQNPVKKSEPKLEIKEYHYYEGKVTWTAKVKIADSAVPGPITVEVTPTILACKASCLPPEKVPVKALLTVKGDGKIGSAIPPIVANPPTNPEAGPPTAAVGGADQHRQSLEAVLSVMDRQQVAANTGLGSFLLTAVFWGAVSLVTPCVFPMIPITVSFFLKQSDKTHVSPLKMAIVYCVTIVVVLGAASLTLLGFFSALSINPWMNTFLGLLFVAMALSLFGMYDLTLPSFLSQFTSSRTDKGGLIGTIFMALTFTIVSFTCVAPFLGGFGGMAASGQFSTLELILGALTFSATFASPFFLLALFPSLLKRLPKSGSWLHTVKVVMGFLELAAALKFFRTAELIFRPQPVLFTFDFVLGMWVALSLVCGLYLLNMIRLEHDDPTEGISVPRFLFGAVFVGLALYLMPALFAGVGGEKQRPKGVVYAWVDSFLLPDPAHGKTAGLEWTGDLAQALNESRQEAIRTGKDRFVFVDFTGKTCSNCKLNERDVFTRPEVQELFQPFRRVQLFTDEVPEELYPASVRSQFKGSVARQEADALANRWFQNEAFGSSQLPLYAILQPTIDNRVKVVAVYDEGKINNVAAFEEFLRKPFQSGPAVASR